MRFPDGGFHVDGGVPCVFIGEGGRDEASQVFVFYVWVVPGNSGGGGGVTRRGEWDGSGHRCGQVALLTEVDMLCFRFGG